MNSTPMRFCPRASLRMSGPMNATRAAVRHLKREPLPEKVMLPAEVIDKTNYKAWLVPVDQRTCPEWSEVAR